MEGRESPLSCDSPRHKNELNTDNPNLRGTPCDPNGLRPSHLYTFNQRDLRDDESTQTKTLCAFCGETARAAHTITVRTQRPRPGGAGAAATARASLAVKRPTRWCDLRCPAHPVPPGRGARRAPPHPLRGGRSPAHAGAPPLPPSGETEEASEPSARRLSSTGNLLSAGGEDRSSSVGRAHGAQQTECEARRARATGVPSGGVRCQGTKCHFRACRRELEHLSLTHGRRLALR